MQSTRHSETPHRSLKFKMTLRYAVALSIIASVMLVSYSMIVRQISLNEKDAHIINISGMQRMLSQRIALMAREIYHAEDRAQADIYYEKMKAVTARMIANHAALSTGDLKEKGRYTLSPVIRNMYFGANGIDENVLAYTGYAQEFLDLYAEEGLEGVRGSVLTSRIVEVARNGLIKKLNKAVSQYEQESYIKIQNFKRIEAMCFIFGLIIILAEILFIFKPMVSSVTRSVEDMEQANAELVEFSYRISHDLRAPIMSSQGLVDVASKAVASGNEDIAQKALGHIKTSMIRLEELIADVLNLMQMKMVDTKEESVDVADLVRTVIKKLDHMPDFEKIKITTDIALQDPITIKKILLQQSLENLLSNAVKYHDPEMKEPSLKVAVFQKQGQCVVMVTDNGLGIPESYRGEVFEMFKRFHPDKAVGSGLGLYLVKQNVKSLNGQVDYIPLDKGSKFEMTFPFA